MIQDSPLDPNAESYWKSADGMDAPANPFHHLCGAQYPTEEALASLIRKQALPPGEGTSLPFASPIVRAANGAYQVVHKRHFTLEYRKRDAHISIWGINGTGKSTRVVRPLLLADLDDPNRTTVVASLKGEEYPLLAVACRQADIPLYYVDLGDPTRSLGFNPLATDSVDEAREVLSGFAAMNQNPQSHDSDFWPHSVTTLGIALWECGDRSFPALCQAVELGTTELLARLRQGGTPACTAAASFIQGGSHNSDTVLATVSGWLNPFRSGALAATMAVHELDAIDLTRGRSVVCIRCDESKLTSTRCAYNMLLQWLFRRIIEQADAQNAPPHPVSVFIEDLPAWGAIPALPDQLNTLRSRRCNVVAAIQSMHALRHAYGASAGLIAAALATRILLPGLDADDARYFSAMTGDRIVALDLPDGAVLRGQPLALPLLSAAEIRSPQCSHFMSGSPVTIITPELAFQAYLPPIHRRPDLIQFLAQVAREAHRPRRRRKALQAVRTPPGAPATPAGGYVPPAGLTAAQWRARIDEQRKRIGWDETTGSARRWWEAFETENAERLPIVDRLIYELAVRKATITEFFLAYVYSNTSNIQGNLHYLDYIRLKKTEQPRAADTKVG